MATATITVKKGTTTEWIASNRVLDDAEIGLEITEENHRIIRIGDGATPFMGLPVTFDIEEVRKIKEGMDNSSQTYFEKLVATGEELLAEMKEHAYTLGLTDDETEITYRMGLSNGAMYFEEVLK